MTAHLLPSPYRIPSARPAAPRVTASAQAASADDRLREAVLARLGAQDWWDAGTSNVFVDGGTVVLQGLVRNGNARLAGRRLAEAVPGVHRVWDARVLPRG